MGLNRGRVITECQHKLDTEKAEEIIIPLPFLLYFLFPHSHGRVIAHHAKTHKPDCKLFIVFTNQSFLEISFNHSVFDKSDRVTDSKVSPDFFMIKLSILTNKIINAQILLVLHKKNLDAQLYSKTLLFSNFAKTLTPLPLCCLSTQIPH